MSESPTLPLWVLDSSVAVKLYLNEEYYEEARDLASHAENDRLELVAPTTISAEVFNAFWQNHRRGTLGKEEARNLWREFDEDVPLTLFDTQGFARQATEIAYETEVIVYDALFLALADALNTSVITADEKTVLNRIAGTPYEHLAVHLRDAAKYLPEEPEDGEEQDG